MKRAQVASEQDTRGYTVTSTRTTSVLYATAAPRRGLQIDLSARTRLSFVQSDHEDHQVKTNLRASIELAWKAS